MIPVPNRTRETLTALITKWIEPGRFFYLNINTTTIVSDGWAAYMNISSIPGYRYTHLSVNRYENFVDPSTGALKNSVEGNWRWARAFMPVTGTRMSLCSSYLLEYSYRNQFLGGCNSRSFDIFLSHLRQIYNPYSNVSIHELHNLNRAESFFLPTHDDPMAFSFFIARFKQIKFNKNTLVSK
ncbi:hypothetical protein HZS_4841 [Henneguya salminicola]|nr:hypothetical protein HZS_4841 [Henneguya salminicola]